MTRDKSAQVQSLIDHFCNGNKAQFAQMLGVKPPTINAWITRNTYDAALVFIKCKGVSAEWLLSGNGPMMCDDTTPSPKPVSPSIAPPPAPASVDNSHLIDIIRRQAEVIGALRVRLAQMEARNGAE